MPTASGIWMHLTASLTTADKSRSTQKVAILALLICMSNFACVYSKNPQDLIPHPCDTYKCPPLTEITCPDDSSVRENLSPLGLLHALQTTAGPNYEEKAYNNSNAIATNIIQHTEGGDDDDDLYAQCCLNQKCICKTCYIQACGAKEVTVEIVPESLSTPGKCCGQYECRVEPNCTDVRNTATYWLTDCQRCRCYLGERICHQSCEEGIMKKYRPMCKSMNTFFEHGDVWKNGCYECECVNGEEKCVMPFCRSLNCPPSRQVFRDKDSCCPICWPKGIPMPNEEGDDMDDDENDENFDDDDDDQTMPPPMEFEVNETDVLPNILVSDEKEIKSSSTTTTSTMRTTTITTTTTATSTPSPCSSSTTEGTATHGALAMRPGDSPDHGPSDDDASTARHKSYNEVIQVVQSPTNVALYVVILVLVLIILILCVVICCLRAKQRSYRPVSDVDDNFNKPIPKIKMIDSV